MKKIVLLLSILLFVIFSFISCLSTDDFKKKGVLTMAKIYSVSKNFRTGSYYINFEFELNNNKIRSYDYRPLSKKNASSIVGRTIPLIYVPEHPNLPHLLITQDDFSNLDMKYPDSLNWVEN